MTMRPRRGEVAGAAILFALLVLLVVLLVWAAIPPEGIQLPE